MWLCIDQGGHSTRAAVFDEQGRTLSLRSAPLGTRSRAPCYVEHDPVELLESVDRCIRDVAHDLGQAARHIEAAGLATQRSTLVCASRLTGDALTPLISWQDRRGQDDLVRFEPRADRIKELTGLRLSPHYGAGKLRWCLRHLDSVKQKLGEDDLIGAPLASYLLHHLCGRGAWRVDPANASRTLLMDMSTGRWSQELLELFGLPIAMLPEICPCRADFGLLDLGGLAAPLTVSTGDQSAALFCLGEPDVATAFVNIGTGAFVQAVAGRAPILDPGLLSSIVWQDGAERLYVLEGTVNGAASALDAVAEELGQRLDPSSPELALALANMETAPLFLNGVSGLGSPDWVASFESRFEGEGSAAARVAAVYESIVFLIVRNLDRIRRHLPLGRVTISGGLAQMDWVAQTLADLAKLTVSRPLQSEATLMGLAFLVSEGRIQLQHRAERFEPALNPGLRARYERWTAAMEAALRA